MRKPINLPFWVITGPLLCLALISSLLVFENLQRIEPKSGNEKILAEKEFQRDVNEYVRKGYRTRYSFHNKQICADRIEKTKRVSTLVLYCNGSHGSISIHVDLDDPIHKKMIHEVDSLVDRKGWFRWLYE